MRFVFEICRRWIRRWPWLSREVFLYRCSRCGTVTARSEHQLPDDEQLRCMACGDSLQFHTRVYYDHEETRFREFDP